MFLFDLFKLFSVREFVFIWNEFIANWTWFIQNIISLAKTLSCSYMYERKIETPRIKETNETLLIKWQMFSTFLYFVDLYYQHFWSMMSNKNDYYSPLPAFKFHFRQIKPMPPTFDTSYLQFLFAIVGQKQNKNSGSNSG